MATSGAIRAGRAFVELFTDDAKLVRGLRNAETQIKNFGTNVRDIGLNIGAAGAAVATPLLLMAKSFADAGDEIGRMSQITGMSVADLGALKYAAGQADVGFSGLVRGVRFMQKGLDAANQGNKQATETLTRLGISAQDLAGKTTTQQLATFADALAGITDPAAKTALTLKVFGRAGSEMLPMLSRGGAGITELMTKASALGVVLSDEDVKSASDLDDAFKELTAVIASVKNAVGAALAPEIKKFVGWASLAAQQLRKWIAEHKPLIVQMFRVAVAAVVVGAALVGLGVAITALFKIVGAFVAIWTGIKLAFSVIAGLVGALLSPMGILVAAAAALGVYLWNSGNNGGKAMAWLGGKFQGLKSDALNAWGGISAALTAGNIPLAMKILWLTVKLEWLKGTKPLKEIWYQLSGWFLKEVDTFSGLFVGAWESTWDSVKTLFFDICDAIHEKFLWMLKGILSLIGPVAEKLMDMVGLGAKARGLASINQLAAGGAIGQPQADELRGILEKYGSQAAMSRVGEMNRSGLLSDIVAESLRLSLRDSVDLAMSDLSNQMNSIGERQTRRWDERFARHPEMAAQIADSAHNMDVETKNAIEALDAEIAKARGEWQSAIDRAKAEAAGKTDRHNNGNDSKTKLGLEPLKLAKMSVMGTFSASAAGGMGFGSQMERLTKASEKTAQNTEEIADNMDGAEFV